MKVEWDEGAVVLSLSVPASSLRSPPTLAPYRAQPRDYKMQIRYLCNFAIFVDNDKA